MVDKKIIKHLVTEVIENEIESEKPEERYLTPEQLCDRWQITLRTLDAWRLRGKSPIFLKIQGGVRSHVRYPLYAKGGILDVEAQWLRGSTTDQN